MRWRPSAGPGTARGSSAALARIAETAKAARLSPALEGTLAERLLLDLGALGREAKV